MEDRRIFARMDINLPVKFLDSNNGSEGKASTIDISANGFGLATDVKLSAKTPLEMWLEIPDQHDPFYTRGEVVWTKNLSGIGNYRAGVRLEKAELMGLARVLWLKDRHI